MGMALQVLQWEMLVSPALKGLLWSLPLLALTQDFLVINKE